MTVSKAILELYSPSCINVTYLLNDLEQVISDTVVLLYYYVNLSSAVSFPAALWLSISLWVVRSPSLYLLARSPRFFQIYSRCIYTLHLSLATAIYLCVCVKHVNNELRASNRNTLYSMVQMLRHYIYIINHDNKFANVKCSDISSVS